jgi:secreted trypsin-like serine protease
LQRKATIEEKLPQLFRDDILCAGSHIGGQGSCLGDSGGPLMYYDLDTNSWIQFATVQGSVGDCGDKEYPGIYIRLDHVAVLSFISKTIKKTGIIQTLYFKL